MKFLTQKLYLHSELDKILLLEIRSLRNGISIFKSLSFRRSVPENITTIFNKKKKLQDLLSCFEARVPLNFIKTWETGIVPLNILEDKVAYFGIDQFMWTSIFFLSLWSWWRALTKKERKKERKIVLGRNVKRWWDLRMTSCLHLILPWPTVLQVCVSFSCLAPLQSYWEC